MPNILRRSPQKWGNAKDFFGKIMSDQNWILFISYSVTEYLSIKVNESKKFLRPNCTRVFDLPFSMHAYDHLQVSSKLVECLWYIQLWIFIDCWNALCNIARSKEECLSTRKKECIESMFVLSFFMQTYMSTLGEFKARGIFMSMHWLLECTCNIARSKI